MSATEHGKRQGLVLAIAKGRAEVLVGDELVDAQFTGNMARRAKHDIAVGDEVVLDGVWLAEVLPRRTKLTRPYPGDRRLERLIVANVDVVGIVAACRKPTFRRGLIDRLLVAVYRGGPRPIIVITKSDLLKDRAGLEAELAPYRELEITIVFCSAKTGQGLDELREAIRGELSVFVGHSGVGKSSLLATLSGLAIETGEVRAYDGKGRHTTTRSRLHDLGDGTRIIDTPGIRSFGVGKIDYRQLAEGFPEIAHAAERCRWNDCKHAKETACGVKEAVEAGTIQEVRYRSYLRLLDELG